MERRIRVRTKDNLVIDLDRLIGDSQPVLRVKRLTPEAKLPTRGSEAAIGYDLYACDKVLLPAQGPHRRVGTGIAVAIPDAHYGRVAPRSGLAAKHGVDVLAGVIDADYRGEIQVILINHGHDPLWINPGDRIAQLILERASIMPVDEVAELDGTARGAAGFGSTGT